ncbi:MAG: glycosyltransferase family 4 protein, partial [Bacillota bacterium]
DRLPWRAETRVPVYLVKPDGIIRDLPEIAELAYNRQLIKAGREILAKERPGLIYQRYSLNNYAGVYLAREFNIPFVLEYNGSFPWMARHWGRPLRFEKIAAGIELRVCRLSDLIVVVSAPMKEELVQRGVKEEKILVNPNGVDPERYSPLVDGGAVRRRYGLEGKTVVGFSGTFGQWHGADKLAGAAALILSRPEGREDLRFLFIGDGPVLPAVKKITSPFSRYCIFTGMVPQEEGPRYLAACDILAAPHLPNPDGTPFFGSPTKLFEYMAMGRGIVASRLGQMGEILEQRGTALLVEPGNAAALADGILQLARDHGLRLMLGRNARQEVLEKYTWEKHTGRILAALERTFFIRG